MKYVCRQINPEYQESPMMLWNDMEDNEVYHGLFLIPDRWSKGIRETALKEIREGMEDIISEYDDIRDYGESRYYKNFSHAVNEIIPREDGKKYSTKQIHEWKELAESFDEVAEDYEKILSLVTGKEWNTKAIRGYSQGDYAEIIYSVSEWTDKAIEYLESEYFNMGSEWECDCTGIEDTAEINENVLTDSTDTMCAYAYEWNDEAIRAELADFIGCDTQDVVMFKYSGCHSVADYEMI